MSRILSEAPTAATANDPPECPALVPALGRRGPQARHDQLAVARMNVVPGVRNAHEGAGAKFVGESFAVTDGDKAIVLPLPDGHRSRDDVRGKAPVGSEGPV